MTRRAWIILASHNLPWVLWTLAAVCYDPLTRWFSFCPMHALLNWCPACGLTGAYHALLTGQGATDWRLWVILTVFAGNAGWSAHLARQAITSQRAYKTIPPAKAFSR